MFSFKYKGADGCVVPAVGTLTDLAKTKGLMSLSTNLGKISAINLDAAKRGMCELRKQCLCSVDALVVGIDNRFYFIEFKDRNLWSLNSQGRNPLKDEISMQLKKKGKDKHHLKRSKDNTQVKSGKTIDVELKEKMFDSILLAGLGDEQWCSSVFRKAFAVVKGHEIVSLRRNSVFVLVYNDMSYDKHAICHENQFMDAAAQMANLESCKDPKIKGARIYWKLDQFVKNEYYSEVHTLNVPEFESYALNRFISL